MGWWQNLLSGADRRFGTHLAPRPALEIPEEPGRAGPVIQAGDATIQPQAWPGLVAVLVRGVAEDEERRVAREWDRWLGPQALADLCETVATGATVQRTSRAQGRTWRDVLSLEPLSPDYKAGEFVFFYPPREDWMTLRLQRAPLRPALREVLDWMESNAEALDRGDAAALRRARRALGRRTAEDGEQGAAR